LPDDYNYPKKLARKELDYHLSKLQDVNFKNRAAHLPYFNKSRQVYDHMADGYTHPGVEVKKERAKNQVELGIHDKPFFPAKPPKTGIIDKSIGGFPEYKENPLKFVTRQPVNEDAPPPFKKTHNVKSRPSPSVQTNLRNLKASFPSVFRR